MYKYKARYFDNGGIDVKDVLLAIAMVFCLVSVFFVNVVKIVVEWVIEKIKNCIGWL